MSNVATGIASPAELEALRKKILDGRDAEKPVISICAGTGCLAYGCTDVIAAYHE
jgi:hypothetical protein